MTVVNKCDKIIGIGGGILLPGNSMELPAAFERNSVITHLVHIGKLAVAKEEAPTKPLNPPDNGGETEPPKPPDNGGETGSVPSGKKAKG